MRLSGLRLYPAELDLAPSHTSYGWGPADDFGNTVLVPLTLVIYYDFSSTHDQFALTAYQLPHPYRRPLCLGSDDAQ